MVLCCGSSLLFVGFFGFLAYVFLKIRNLSKPKERPHVDTNKWWGRGSPGDEDKSIKPFKISVDEDTLKDLKQRLLNHRAFTPPLEGVAQNYGMNTNLLNEIVKYWTEEYNWKEREEFLNKFPQYTVSVQGLKIHYIHVKPTPTEGIRVLPLLLLHGWPGSVREFYEIIPLLTTPREDKDFVFEVIVPSLPGYGFSEGTSRPGFGVPQAAVVFKNLMERVGFEKYYIQGGDWGAAIVRNMAALFPENILGVHSNMATVGTPLARIMLFLGSFWPSLVFEEGEAVHKAYPLGKVFKATMLETGYMHLQASKPDTVGVALNDSPAGLAAYILEKFTTWTRYEWKNRDDGGLKEKFTYANLLDNVMIYWISNSVTTSVRFYAETFGSEGMTKVEGVPITVPSGCMRCLHDFDMAYAPKSILKLSYKNLLHVSDKGVGHFAAFEAPEILADDIFVAVKKFDVFNRYAPKF